MVSGLDLAAFLDFFNEYVVDVEDDDIPLDDFFLLFLLDSLSKSPKEIDGTLDQTKFTADIISLNDDSNESVHLAPRM